MRKARYDAEGHVLKTGEGQRENGRYYYQYRDPAKRRRVIYATSLSKLREKEQSLQELIFSGINYSIAVETTLNQEFDKYMYFRADLADTTKMLYFSVYNRYVRESIGKNKILNIKYSDIRYFFQDLAVRKKLKYNTLNKIFIVLYPSFELARRDELIKANPCRGMRKEIKVLCEPGKRREALSEEEQKAFLDYVAASPTWRYLYHFFVVMFGTGMRYEELAALTWSCVDFESEIIAVKHALVYTDGFHIKETKSMAGSRCVPMLSVVKEVLLEEYQFQKANGFSKLKIDALKGFVFTNKSGLPYRACSLNYYIKRICHLNNQKNGVIIRDFSCHNIRHTFCARLCENESNIKLIQEVMGHNSFKTTMDIYAEVSKKKKIESFEKLSEKMNDLF